MDSLPPLRFYGAVGTLRPVSASCERGGQLVRYPPRQIHHRRLEQDAVVVTAAFIIRWDDTSVEAFTTHARVCEVQVRYCSL